jgi:hypothetical protein
MLAHEIASLLVARWASNEEMPWLAAKGAYSGHHDFKPIEKKPWPQVAGSLHAKSAASKFTTTSSSCSGLLCGAAACHCCSAQARITPFSCTTV